MDTISISDVLYVDSRTIDSDGRVYIGREHSDESVKVILIDES
jgi:hypothetical protein